MTDQKPHPPHPEESPRPGDEPADEADLEIDLEPDPDAPEPDSDDAVIGLEPDESAPPRRSSSSDLTCPDCGAPMPGPETLVCLRCGYDLKSLRKITTSTGEEEVQEDAEPVVLAMPGRGGTRGPLIFAGICAAIIIVCLLAGVHGVHPRVAAASGGAAGPIDWGERFLGVLRYLVHAGLWTGAGAAGLIVVAWLGAATIGAWPLALARLLAIAAAMKLVTVLALGGGPLEWMAEAAGQAGLAFIGLLVLFDLKPRDALWALGTSAGAFLVVYAGAQLLVWVS